jgi:hypothetical protein
MKYEQHGIAGSDSTALHVMMRDEERAASASPTQSEHSKHNCIQVVITAWKDVE